MTAHHTSTCVADVAAACRRLWAVYASFVPAQLTLCLGGRVHRANEPRRALSVLPTTLLSVLDACARACRTFSSWHAAHLNLWKGSQFIAETCTRPTCGQADSQRRSGASSSGAHQDRVEWYRYVLMSNSFSHYTCGRTPSSHTRCSHRQHMQGYMLQRQPAAACVTGRPTGGALLR